MAGVAIGSVSLAVGVLGTVSGEANAAPGDSVPGRVVSTPTASPSVDTVSPTRILTPGGVGLIPEGVRPTSTTPSRVRTTHRSRVTLSARPTPTRPRPARSAASRSEHRTPLTPVPATTPSQSLTPRQLARHELRSRGWGDVEWTCLDNLWTRESSWQIHDRNADSGSYGIPQALPASKMATMGADWRDNPLTQIRWGLSYIASRYGTPCSAWAHSEQYNFY